MQGMRQGFFNNAIELHVAGMFDSFSRKIMTSADQVIADGERQVKTNDTEEANQTRDPKVDMEPHRVFVVGELPMAAPFKQRLDERFANSVVTFSSDRTDDTLYGAYLQSSAQKMQSGAKFEGLDSSNKCNRLPSVDLKRG